MSKVLDFVRAKVPLLKHTSDADLTVMVGDALPKFFELDPSFRKRYDAVVGQRQAERDKDAALQAEVDSASQGGFFERAGKSFLKTSGDTPGALGMSALRLIYGEDAENLPAFRSMKDAAEERNLYFGSGDTAGDFAGSIAANVVQMAAAPGAALKVASAVPKVGAALAASPTIARLAAFGPNLALAGGLTLNPEYEQARREGASQEEAYLQGLSAAAIEGVSDAVLGVAGRVAGGAVGDVLSKAGLRAAVKPSVETAEDLLKQSVFKPVASDALREGTQESVAGALTDASANAIYDAKRNVLFDENGRITKERMMDFIGGGLGAPVFTAVGRSQARQTVKGRVETPESRYVEKVNELLEIVDPELYQRARAIPSLVRPDGMVEPAKVSAFYRQSVLKSSDPEVNNLMDGLDRPEIFNLRLVPDPAPTQPNTSKAAPTAPAPAAPAPVTPTPPLAGPVSTRSDILQRALAAAETAVEPKAPKVTKKALLELDRSERKRRKNSAATLKEAAALDLEPVGSPGVEDIPIPAPRPDPPTSSIELAPTKEGWVVDKIGATTRHRFSERVGDFRVRAVKEQKSEPSANQKIYEVIDASNRAVGRGMTLAEARQKAIDLTKGVSPEPEPPAPPAVAEPPPGPVEVSPPSELSALSDESLDRAINNLTLQLENGDIEPADESLLDELEAEYERRQNPSAELPYTEDGNTRDTGDTGREVLGGTPPGPRDDGGQPLLRGRPEDPAGVVSEEDSPPPSPGADGGSEADSDNVRSVAAPPGDAVAAFDRLPVVFSGNADRSQFEAWVSTKSPEDISRVVGGLDTLARYPDAIQSAIDANGIVFSVRFSDIPNSSGFDALSDGQTIRFDPVVFGETVAMLERGGGKTLRKDKHLSGFKSDHKGVDNLLDEELKHVVTFRVFREEYDSLGDVSQPFERWLFPKSEAILRSASAKFREFAKSVYGDHPLLGMELIRLHLQWIRNGQSGGLIFTEDYTQQVESSRKASRQLLKAFKDSDSVFPSFLSRLVDYVAGRREQFKETDYEKSIKQVSAYIDTARKSAEAKRGRPQKQMSFEAIEDLRLADQARVKSMTADERQAFEVAETAYKRLVDDDGLTADVDNRLRLYLKGEPGENIRSEAFVAALRNIVSRAGKLANAGAANFASIFGPGGVNFGVAVQLAVQESAKKYVTTLPDGTLEYNPQAYAGISIDQQREDSNREFIPDDPDDYAAYDDFDDSNDVLGAAPVEPEFDPRDSKVMSSVWSTVKNHADGFEDEIPPSQGRAFKRWRKAVDWRSLSTLESFQTVRKQAVEALGEDGDVLEHAISQFIALREVRLELSNLIGIEPSALSAPPRVEAGPEDAAYLKLAKDPEKNKTALQWMVDEAAERMIKSFPESNNDEPIPNLDSMDGEDYTEMGVREVPTSLFSGEGKKALYDVKDHIRVDALIESIREEGVRSPLIVVIDGHPDGPAYILEGGHRLAAIEELGLQNFPALVLYDESADPVTYDAQGNIIPLSQRFDSSKDEFVLSAPPRVAPTVQQRIDFEKTRIAEIGRPEIQAHTEQAARKVTQAYASAEFIKAHADLSRVRDLANSEVSEEDSFTLTDPELINYAPRVGIEPGAYNLARELVELEQAASRVAYATGAVRDEMEVRRLLQIQNADPAKIAFQERRVSDANKALVKMVRKLKGRQDVIARAGEMIRHDDDFIDIESSARLVNNPLVRGVFGDRLKEADALKALTGLTPRDLTELQASLSTPLTDESSEADIAVRYQALDQVKVMQEQLKAFRRAYARMGEKEAKHKANLLPALTELQQEMLDNSDADVEASKFLHDVASAAKKKGIGTGSFLSPTRVQFLQDHIGAVKNLLKNLATRPDGSAQDAVYNVLFNPPTVKTPARILLSELARSMKLTVNEIASKVGVSEVVLRGVVELAHRSGGVADTFQTLTSFFEALPYVQKNNLLKDSTPEELEALVGSARSDHRFIRSGVRTAARRVRRVQASLHTYTKIRELFDVVLNSKEFGDLETFLDNPLVAPDTGYFRMDSYTRDAVILSPFSGPGVDQKELKIAPDLDDAGKAKWLPRIQEWYDNARTYAHNYTEARNRFRDGKGANPETLGFDPRLARGLLFSLNNRVPALIDAFTIQENGDYARVPRFVSSLVGNENSTLGPILNKLFAQPLRVAQWSNTSASKLLAGAMNDVVKADRVIQSVRNRHDDMARVRQAAVRSHSLKWNTDMYDENVFQPAARLGRMFGSPVKAGFVLPTGYAVTPQDVAYLRKLEKVSRELALGVEGVEEVVGGRTLVREARVVGDFNISRKVNFQYLDGLRLKIDAAFSGDGSGALDLSDMKPDLTDGSAQETFWDSTPDLLLSYVMDSKLPESDRTWGGGGRLQPLLSTLADRISGDPDVYNTLREGLTVSSLIRGDESLGFPGLMTVSRDSSLDEPALRRLLAAELAPFIKNISSRFKEISTNQSTSVDVEVMSNANQFTRPANKLELPSAAYRYGALSDVELHSFYSAPRIATEIRMLNLFEQMSKEMVSVLADESRPIPKQFRNRAQYRRMAGAIQLVIAQMKAVRDTPADLQRLYDKDMSPGGLRSDLTSVLTSMVLSGSSVVVGNTLLAPMATFVLEARLAGTLAGVAQVLKLLGHTGARLGVRVVEGAVSAAASGVDKTFLNRIGGKDSLVGFVDGLMDVLEERILSHVNLDVRNMSRELKDLGMIHRPKWTHQIHEAISEYQNDRVTRGVASSGVSLALKIATATSNKVGIDFGDVIINMGGLAYSESLLRRLDGWAESYGAHMDRLDPGKDFRPGDALWRINAKRNPFGVAEDRVLEARRFFETSGFSLEQILWTVHSYNKSRDAGLLAVASGDPDMGGHAELKNRYDALRTAIKRMTIEEVNSPGRLNRSFATKSGDRFWRIMSPLQGYTGDHVLKVLEYVSGPGADDDTLRKWGKLLIRLTGYTIAALITGMVSVTGREETKRLTGRSTGLSVLTDADFYKELTRAYDRALAGDVRGVLDSTHPMLVAMAGAIPYAGDIILMGLGQVGLASSRGHLLDFSSRSLALQFIGDVATSIVGVGTLAAKGMGGHAVFHTLDDFSYRWLPYYDAVSKTLDIHGGSREKYMNSIALRREAIASGLVEPSMASRVSGGLGFVSPLRLFKRRFGNAISSRDEKDLKNVFYDVVKYYQNGDEARKRSRRESVRLARSLFEQLSPASRAVDRTKITGRESRELKGSVTGRRRGRLDEALEDFSWGARRLRADPTPELRN